MAATWAFRSLGFILDTPHSCLSASSGSSSGPRPWPSRWAWDALGALTAEL